MSCTDDINASEQSISVYAEVLLTRNAAFLYWVRDNKLNNQLRNESEWDDLYTAWLNAEATWPDEEGEAEKQRLIELYQTEEE